MPLSPDCNGHELFSVCLADSPRFGECVAIVDNETEKIMLALPATTSRKLAASLLNSADLLDLPFEQRAEAARRMGYEDGDL